MNFHVYSLASRRNAPLYIGMTDDLARRMWEHQIGPVADFTKKYGAKSLCGSSSNESREGAFQRERQLKNGIEPGSLN